MVTCAMAEKKTSRITTIRLRAEDEARVAKLLEATGASNVSELVRLALRALAKKEGVK